MAYTMEDYKRAIASIESSEYKNPYAATGVWVKRRDGSRDRAYGKYQIMGANIPSWTKRWLGRAMTPQEFLASPDAQEKTFVGQFGSYVNKYGTQGAAQAWIGGPGIVGVAGEGPKDTLGTSVAEYSRRFNRALGAPPPMAAAPSALPPTGIAPTSVLPQPAALPPSVGNIVNSAAPQEGPTPSQQQALTSKIAQLLGFPSPTGPAAQQPTMVRDRSYDVPIPETPKPVPLQPLQPFHPQAIPLGTNLLQRRQMTSPYKFYRG